MITTQEGRWLPANKMEFGLVIQGMWLLLKRPIIVLSKSAKKLGTKLKGGGGGHTIKYTVFFIYIICNVNNCISGLVMENVGTPFCTVYNHKLTHIRTLRYKLFYWHKNSIIRYCFVRANQLYYPIKGFGVCSSGCFIAQRLDNCVLLKKYNEFLFSKSAKRPKIVLDIVSILLVVMVIPH